MAKLTLTDISDFRNQTATANTINSNNSAIETALENTLSRDGTSPNQMNSDLDMNSNDILNVGDIDASTGTIDTLSTDTFYLDGVRVTTNLEVDVSMGTSGYALIGNGASPASFQGFTQTGTGATTRTWQTKAADTVNARDFGVTADGTTDDTAALQAAVTYAGTNGWELVLPAGSIKITSRITIPPATNSPPPYSFFSIRGQGKAATKIQISGNVGAFIYTGGATSQSFIQFANFEIAGGGAQSNQIGIDLNLASFFTIRDMYIAGCAIAIRGIDALTGVIDNCILRFNTGGIYLAKGASNTPPNAITISACEIGANASYAIYADRPSCLTVRGGAIEGNGYDATQSLRCGIRIIDAGWGGGVGLNVEDVYFEINETTADIWISQTQWDCNHWIAGNSFSRVGNVNYVTNNILLDCDSGIALKTFIAGNGFKGFGGYVPSASHLYVDTSNCLGTSWQVTYTGNQYQSATETPVGQLGSSDNRLVRTDGTDGQSAQSTGITVDDSNYMTGVARLGIGASNLLSSAVQGQLSNDGFATWAISAHGVTSDPVGALLGYRSRGTNASPSIVSDGDSLFQFFARGYDGTAYRNSAGFFFEVDGTPGAGDMPGRIRVMVSPDGTSTLSEAFRFSNDLSALAAGKLTSNAATGGVGYSSGAGGTVTQATDKSTGVTVNKVSGSITMNNAALGASSLASFVVTNSAVAATDVVIVNVSSGGTANAYRADVTAIAAGSFTITVQNITGGSLSESPVLSFAVIKAVTS